ncbi:MAG: SET domain-containing protein-lysine N-methyltransferase, partial [Hydrococcus sp. RM1_1_31]|nr:SET domain-containing protein-lysine N-methyltransferase [Hydrococcus sp. RM1_1_31]
NLDKPFDCLPEEGIARTRVMPDDILNYHQDWDRQVAEVIPYFERVEQPLKYLIEKQNLARINAVIEQKIPLDSMLTTYYVELKNRI